MNQINMNEICISMELTENAFSYKVCRDTNFIEIREFLIRIDVARQKELWVAYHV